MPQVPNRSLAISRHNHVIDGRFGIDRGRAAEVSPSNVLTSLWLTVYLIPALWSYAVTSRISVCAYCRFNDDSLPTYPFSRVGLWLPPYGGSRSRIHVEDPRNFSQSHLLHQPVFNVLSIIHDRIYGDGRLLADRSVVSNFYESRLRSI